MAWKINRNADIFAMTFFSKRKKGDMRFVRQTVAAAMLV